MQLILSKFLTLLQPAMQRYIAQPLFQATIPSVLKEMGEEEQKNYSRFLFYELKLYALLKLVSSLPNKNSNFPLIWECAQGNQNMAGPKFIWLSASLNRIHVSETGSSNLIAGLFRYLKTRGGRRKLLSWQTKWILKKKASR